MIDKITYLETENEKFPMIFTLNVMETMQEKYGSLDKWSSLLQNKKEPNIKAIKFFITEAINEGIEIENEKKGEKRPTICQKKAGRILTDIGISEATKKITGTITESVKTGEKSSKNDQTTKNQTA